MKHILKVVCAVVAFFSFAPLLFALKGINLSSGSLVPYFSEDITKYNVFVPGEVENINITAIEDKDDDYITGTGNISLLDGKNEVILKVIKKNLDVITYEIAIFKNYKENKDEENATLNKLEIEGYDIDFNTDIYEYEIYVDIEERLNISYEQTSEYSTVKISGNSNFKIGQNTVKISVISKNKTNVNVYVIKVNKVSNVFEELSSEKENNIIIKRKFTKKETTLIIVSMVSFCIFLIILIFHFMFLKRKRR